MHHPTDRITHTTAFVTPVVENWLEREINTTNMSEGILNIVIIDTGTEGRKEGRKCFI